MLSNDVNLIRNNLCGKTIFKYNNDQINQRSVSPYKQSKASAKMNYKLK